MRRRLEGWLVPGLLALVAFTFAAPLFAQRADRGIITGFVTDSTGAAIPKALVRVTDEATNVATVAETTDSGNYTTPLLILGAYTITIEKEGFKKYVRPGILLTAGAEYRQDATLQVGAVSQTVEVTATAQMINVQNSEVSHIVNEKFYHDLPVVMGADIRLAESLLHVQPGYVPMQPNGDTMFRGTQFNSRINGGQTMTVENWFDGAAFGFGEGHQQTQESALPIEAVREMKVISGTFSAQYGHSSGGVIEYVTKSGTSQFHGNVYDYLGNDALFARGFFLPKKNSVRQNNWGVSAGGPVIIPKIYNGKGRTFFFTNLDKLDMTQGIESGFTNTVPLPAFLQGNFSRLLGAQLPVKDALGRNLYQGEIFNPATTRNVNGVPVRDGYGFDPVTGNPLASANIIPAGDPLRSQIAGKIVPLIPAPFRDQLNNNLLGGQGDASHIFHITTWLLRADHTINSNLKSTTTYFQNNRPSVRHCGEVQECNVPNDPFTSPEKNTDYIGSGFYQKIYNKFAHQQFDWIIKPNVFNHTTLSYDRWWIGGHALGVSNWNARLGIKGIPDDGGAFPNLNFGGSNIPYSHLGRAWSRGDGYDANNRWQFLDDVTWIKGKHTVKAGVEYRFHQFPSHGWSDHETMGSYSFNSLSTGGYDNAGNTLSSTGDPYASFLLGQVFNSSFTIPARTNFYEKYEDLWVNDEYKFNDRLTLQFGLRWDYVPPRVEMHDRYSSFDPTLANPGAGNLPGAIAFAGTGPGRTGKRTFDGSIKDAIGPRFGFAYRLGDKNVVRGGYGMYFSNVPFSQFAARPIVGFNNNPSAPNLTNGQQPAFYWDNGFPQANVKFPPLLDPTIQNFQGPVAVAKDGLTLPRYQNWNLTVERQLTDNLRLDISYVGNHGTRLPAAGMMAGIADNANNPRILSLGAALLQSTSFNDPRVVAAGIKLPYAGFPGNVAQAARLYPHYQNIDYRDLPVGNSIYHALQVTLDRRWSNGLQARVAYTWSKLINDGAESAQGHEGPTSASSWQGNGVQNPLDTHHSQRGLSSDDVPQVLVLTYSYELPFGPGKKFADVHGVLGKVIGGWSLSAIQRYSSGRPVSINMDNNLGGLLFNWGKRPNKVRDTSAQLSNFDPATSHAFDPSAWANPGALNFGNSSRTDPHVRTFHYFNEDFNLFKETYVYKEEVKMRIESQFGNAFNRHFFCNPNNFWHSATLQPGDAFGTVNSQCDVPRRIQFGLRFDW